MAEKREIKTYDKDKRAPITAIYSSLSKLKKNLWKKEILFKQKLDIQGSKIKLPILAFKSKKRGKALWILAGVHGEEPAGPNAIMKNINLFNKLAKKIPIVIIPICNPKGYTLNWRYPYLKKAKKNKIIRSVGDADHLLLDVKTETKSRHKNPSCEEANRLTKFIVKNFKKYPPILVLDFHEDKSSTAGYIYSQGILEERDPIATQIVSILKRKKFPMIDEGETMFNQRISNGIVYSVNDASIDELLSSENIIVRGRKQKGPSAKSVIVIETNSLRIPIKKRISAHSQIMKLSKRFYDMAKEIKPENTDDEGII